MPTKGFRYAGFWVRAAARVIDILVIVGVYNVFYLVDRFGGTAGLWPPGGFGDAAEVGSLSPENIVRGVFFFGFPIFYYVYLHGAYGQTFGKMAFRIQVVNEDGTPLDFRKAFLRWMGYFLCVVTLYIGYLMAAFDRRKQGLHDRVCRTIVVHMDDAPDRSAGPIDATGSASGPPASPPPVSTA